jgi:hypothetical protein
MPSHWLDALAFNSSRNFGPFLASAGLHTAAYVEFAFTRCSSPATVLIRIQPTG